MKAKFEKVAPDTYLCKEICFCYLLIGTKSCLLIDTGIGVADIKEAVDQLIDGKPLIVVNTHGHIDHFGGNDKFEETLVPALDKDVFVLQNNPAFRKIFLGRAPFIMRKMFKRVLIPTKPNHKYFDGDLSIDLGDRVITSIHTPGHTAGSIILLDEKNRLLFGGDTVVPILVLLCLDYSLSPQVFLDTMLKVKAMEDKYDLILPGHHSVTTDKTLVDDYIEVAKIALKEEGNIEFHDIAMARVYEYGKVKLFCKIEYNAK
jgi:glyoxylase-like metal-dependent hydrolase (beta-lactamase superfamily II)